MREPTVASVMTRDVLTVGLDTPFQEVARVLAERGISAVPVVDGDEVVGVVSEADLLAKQEYRSGSVPTPSVFAGHDRKERWRKAFGSTASHVMTKPAMVIDPGAPVAEAVRLLTQANVRRLFVVDREGVLVGVLARRDLLRLYLRDDDDLREAIRDQVFGQVLSTDPDTVDVVVDGGQVRLSGELDRRSETTTAIKLIRVIPGVVDVHSELTYRLDDEPARR
jgi:CBS domain-containing protein